MFTSDRIFQFSGRTDSPPASINPIDFSRRIDRRIRWEETESSLANETAAVQRHCLVEPSSAGACGSFFANFDRIAGSVPIGWLKTSTQSFSIGRCYVACRAGALMAHPAITASPDASVPEPADLLMRHHIKRLPVVRDGAAEAVDFARRRIERADLGFDAVMDAHQGRVGMGCPPPDRPEQGQCLWAFRSAGSQTTRS
jgi:hypothetical protein